MEFSLIPSAFLPFRSSAGIRRGKTGLVLFSSGIFIYNHFGSSLVILKVKW